MAQIQCATPVKKRPLDTGPKVQGAGPLRRPICILLPGMQVSGWHRGGVYRERGVLSNGFPAPRVFQLGGPGVRRTCFSGWVAPNVKRTSLLPRLPLSQETCILLRSSIDL